MGETLIQDGVIRNLQTLAESTRRVSGKLKTEFPNVDWRAIAGFRNIIVHDYLAIDLERIWGVVDNRLPKLKEEIKKMLAKDK